jgi:hypothetical protein
MVALMSDTVGQFAGYHNGLLKEQKFQAGNGTPGHGRSAKDCLRGCGALAAAPEL